jgi:hypothetical protein
MATSQLKYSKQTVTIIIFIIIIGFLPFSANGEVVNDQAIPQIVQTQLDTFIKRQIDRYERENCEPDPDESSCRGTEFKKARRFCLGDLDGDGREDIAVLYTIESFCCGNNYHFFLAVLLNKETNFELIASVKVGGKGERGVAFNTIRNGKILLNTKEYLPDDAMCCPSSKGRTTYTLKKGRLIESDRVGEKPMSPLERYRRASEQIQPYIEKLFKEKEKQNILIEHDIKGIQINADAPTPLDSMDLNQISAFRKEKVEKYALLNLFPKDYDPLKAPHNRIYSRITPKNPWISPVLYHLSNPYLLIILSRDNDVTPLNLFCTDVKIVRSEFKITESHTGLNALCWFEGVFSSDNPPGVAYVTMVNAWDAGFHYVNLVENQCTNIIPSSSNDNIGKIAFSQSSFYHLGPHKRNNISPYDPRARITLKEKYKPTRLVFKLWRKLPASLAAKPDLFYEVNVNP